MSSVNEIDQAIATRQLENLFGHDEFGPLWMPEDPDLAPLWKYDNTLNNTIYCTGLRGIRFSKLRKTESGTKLVKILKKFNLSSDDVIILEFGTILAVLSCVSREFGHSWILIDQNNFSQCNLVELEKILAPLAARKKRQMLLGSMDRFCIDIPPPWAVVTTLSYMRLISNTGFDPSRQLKAINKSQPSSGLLRDYTHSFTFSGKARKTLKVFDCELAGYWIKFRGRFGRKLTVDQNARTRISTSHPLPATITVACAGRPVKDVISFGSPHVDSAFGDCRIVCAGYEEQEFGPPKLTLHLDDPIVTLAPMPKSVKKKARSLGLETAHPLEPWWLT